MNKNLALGLGIGLPILAIGIGYGVYSYYQKKQRQALENSAVGVYERGNNVQSQAAVEPTDYGYNSGDDEGNIQGGRKKTKRRKGKKNASKKKR
jgi:hypothetical protein